jgi:hypothetical protein
LDDLTGSGWRFGLRRARPVCAALALGGPGEFGAALRPGWAGWHLALWHLADVTDRMHALLMDRADALMGCVEVSPEEAELAALTDIIEAYESQRWQLGRIPGGKG